MMLVKNPAGFNQVINLIAHDEGNYKLAFLLNDRFADGTDISWIWDVDFEALADQQVRFTRVLVSGVRADDMALRLKYAGFAPERIEVIREYDKLLTEIGSDETPAFLMRHTPPCSTCAVRSANTQTSRRSTNKGGNCNGTEYLPSLPRHSQSVR